MTPVDWTTTQASWFELAGRSVLAARGLPVALDWTRRSRLLAWATRRQSPGGVGSCPRMSAADTSTKPAPAEAACQWQGPRALAGQAWAGLDEEPELECSESHVSFLCNPAGVIVMSLAAQAQAASGLRCLRVAVRKPLAPQDWQPQR